MIRRHPWRWVAVLVLVALVAGGAVLAVVGRRELEPVQANHQQQVVITVSRGESLQRLVDDLGAKGLVRSRFFFGMYADVRGLGFKLHSGKFILDRGMGPSELVAVLEGPSSQLPITVQVQDGLWAGQEAAVLQRDGLFSAASYAAQVRSGSFSGISLPSGAPAGASWEGMAFGDTYQVSPKVTAHQFLRLQLSDFEKEVAPELASGAAQVGLTPYQVLVLASIVGAEATTAHDRALVAGVFFNRLRLGMPLQSDVTILYALAAAGQSASKFTTQFASPYNTYLHQGLPPGPINSPGVGPVDAVLHPATTNYLYFVSLPSGKMLFAVTAAQHQQQVQAAGLG
ncbi:MAG: endolytic transglycosylase MltG [Candidatus Dormiibacterota bacterium]